MLCKCLWRRPSAPRFDVRHLAVNVVGFSSSLDVRDLKVKVWRCAARLAELGVVRSGDKATIFRKDKCGAYSLIFERGAYFEERRRPAPAPTVSESSLHELLRQL